MYQLGLMGWAIPLGRAARTASFLGSALLAMSASGLVQAPEALASEQARLLLKALADPLRVQVIEALSGGERCVCDLTADLGLAQSKLSFHLKVLKEAGLLADRQEGRWIYYRLQAEPLAQLQTWLAALARGCHTPAQSCC